MVRFQDQRQTGDDQNNRVRFGGEELVRPSLQIAKAPSHPRGRNNPSANFVADNDYFPGTRRVC